MSQGFAGNGQSIISGPAISAGTQSVATGTVVFSNSPTVTFGMSNSSVVTASAAGGGGGLTNINLSAGTTSNLLSAVTFNNANNVSFGLDASTITASVNTSLTNIRVSAGTTSNLLSALTFSNSNGISFGLDASTITASYTVPTITSWTVSDNATSGTVARLAFTNLNGVTLSLSTGAAGLHTIVGSHNALTSQSNQAVSGQNGSFTFETLSFSNANGISFGTSAGPAITASHNALTSQSNQTLGLYAVGNTTGQSSSSTFDARTVSFVGQGVASVGFSNGSVNISVPTGGGGITNINISAGTTSNNLSNFVLSNSNNVSFGLDGSTVTATVTVASTQGSINLSAGTTSNLSASFTFSNANNVSFGLNAGTITASINTSLTNIRVSAGTTSNLLSAITFDNANGISFGLDASTITASHNALTSQSNQAFSADGGSSTFQTLSFRNANGISFSNSLGSVEASLVGLSAGVSNLGNTAGNTTVNTGSRLVFVGNNQITLNQATAAGATTVSFNLPNSPFIAGVSNLGNTAGATGLTGTRLVLVGTNNVTLSQTTDANGATVSISAGGGGGGGGVTLSQFEVIPHITGSSASSHAPASWMFNPFVLPNPLTFSNIWCIKSMSMAANAATSTNSSGVKSIAYSHGVTIFRRVDSSNSSTQLTTVTTGSIGFSLQYSHTSGSQSISASWVTNTTGGLSTFSTSSSNSALVNFFISNRLFAIPMVTSLSEGQYFIAHRHSTTTGTTNINSTAASFSIIHIAPQINNFLPLGIMTQTTSSHLPWGFGFGRASAVTTNNTMAASVIQSTGTQQYWYANFVNLPHQ